LWIAGEIERGRAGEGVKEGEETASNYFVAVGEQSPNLAVISREE